MHQGLCPPLDLLHLIFLLRVVVADDPQMNFTHPVSVDGLGGGLLALRHLSPQADLQRLQEVFGQGHLCGFQGPNQDGAEGLFPGPVPQLRGHGEARLPPPL